MIVSLNVFSRAQLLHQNTTNQLKFWFLVKEEIQSTVGVTSQSNWRGQNRTQPTLVEGNSSYQCSNAAPFFFTNVPLLPTLNRSNALNIYIDIALWCKNQIEHSIWVESLLFCNCACSLEYSSLSTLAGLSYHICGKLEVGFQASPSSPHQHCTDEAQKADIVLSAVSCMYKLYKFFFKQIFIYKQKTYYLQTHLERYLQ